MKKILVLISALGAGLFVVKKRRDAQSEADLWREATSGSDLR
ncbi:MAG TPA: DLW-39 family protein [Mycobacteriales bacterium]|nr:DLW-39 family protein [Mycobacteriales bacterium]